MGLSRPDNLHLALDATVRRSLPTIFFGVGAFYLAVAAVAPMLAEEFDIGARAITRWLGLALVGFAGGLALRRWPARPGWGNPLAGLLGILVILNGLLFVAAFGPEFLFALIVAVVAFALFLLSLPWVVGLSALTLGGWLYLASAAGGGPDWNRGTINLMAFCAVALISQAARIALHRRLEALKLRDLQRIAQESELAREKALGQQRRRIVRMTAHELANPMTPVVLQAHILGRGELSPEQRKNLEVLQRNIDRLQDTIKKVVAAAQADEEASQSYEHEDLDG